MCIVHFVFQVAQCRVLHASTTCAPTGVEENTPQFRQAADPTATSLSDLCLFVCLAKMTKCPHPPRLVELTKWANFPGYGFNLHAEKARQGEKTFFHGHLFPHLVTMDVMNNGTKGIRNTSDSTSLLMVIIKLNQKYKWRGHAWFFFS